MRETGVGTIRLGRDGTTGLEFVVFLLGRSDRAGDDGGPGSAVFGLPGVKNGGSLVLRGLAAIIERVEREGSSFFAQIAGGGLRWDAVCVVLTRRVPLPPWAYYTIRAE